ncbi:MAG: sulfotransferase domain-containing protein [Phycisphaerales bacterium]
MPDPGSTIVVVSGLPRSGTSLMMQMLEAGGIPPFADFERQADDDNPKGYYELEAVKKLKTNPDVLDTAGGKVVKAIHMLLADLPAKHHYKVVFMRRDLNEVLASQRKMLDRSGKKGAALPEAALKKVFEGQLTKVDAWLAVQSNIEVLNVEHRALLNNPAPVIEQINAFLGGQLDTGKMADTVDPTLYRNRA